jgi:hypothetical protein
MSDFFSSDAFGFGVFVLFLGLGFTSWYATRARLRDWAESLGAKILRKDFGWRIDAEKGTVRYVGKGGGAHRVVIDNGSRFVFVCYVDTGGIWATLLNREPVVIWESDSPADKAPNPLISPP